MSEPLQLRLEWGWGPWGDLALERTCDWRMSLDVAGGRLLRHFPCLQSGPFDEALNTAVMSGDEQEARRVARKSTEGVPLDDRVLDDLRALGAELGVEAEIVEVGPWEDAKL